MTTGAGDDTFINHLMDETFSSISEDDNLQSPEELLSYFSEKSENLSESKNWKEALEELGARSVTLEYLEDTYCYRFSNGEKTLDFPSNWSIFSKLKSAQDNNSYFYFRMDQGQDQELWEVLRNEIFQKDHVALAIFDDKPVFIEFHNEESAEEFSDLTLEINSEEQSEDRDVPDLPEVA